MKKLFLILSLLILSRVYASHLEENKRLCDEGNMVGCFNMGFMHMKGIRGAAKDEEKALQFFRKACKGGDIDGCLNAGKYFEEGINVKQDYAKAKEFYIRACDGGEAYACMLLGNFYRDGNATIERDSRKAAHYFKKVCEYGYSEGCKQYDSLKK
jgi:hypothetical protein